jgi:hypothetical protein
VPPPAEHRGDPPAAAGGLVVTVVNAAGHGKVFDFADLGMPEPMQRSLAAVFAARSGRWNSHRSAEGYWNQLLVFARFLAGLDSVPQDVDGLTAAVLKRWRTRHIGTNGGRIALKTVRTLLLHDARLGSGAVAEELARRVPSSKPSKQSYGEAERERVLLVARRQFRSASLRIRENTLLLERWRAGDLAQGSREWRIGRLLDHLADTGDVPRTASASGRGRVSHRRILGGAGVERTWGRLFLTRAELTALAVLLTDRFGWNLSVYDRMPAPTAAPSAGETVTVTYQVQVEKHRSGAGRWWSTENVTDSGADSPGRLITSALEATAHGRALAARLAPGTDLLMTARTGMTGRRIQDRERPRPIDPLCFGVSAYDATHWALGHGLTESPFQRIRRATVTREARPLQHSRATHESIYMLPDRHVQDASRTVFADGAQDALDQARATTFGGRLADTPDPTHQAAATVDCVDESTSPWPAPDGGCGTDFLLCLACRNAHVHPGHHPRLAHLHRQVDSLRSVLPGPVWDRRWRDHLLRLADLRERVGPAAWNSALARVDDTDRVVVDLLLKGDLAP